MGNLLENIHLYKNHPIDYIFTLMVNKARQRTSETVAGIVPYESSLAEHGLKFPEARGRRPIYNSS